MPDTKNTHQLPATTGLDLGSVDQQWDAHIQDLDVYNSINLHGATLAGSFNGNVTGNLTGNVVGNLTGNVVGNVTGNATSASKTAIGDKGFVNVMTDYSTVVGDGVTDDGPAIQAIIDANPSKWIFFPTRSWSATGSTPVSYLSNQRLVMNGNGQVLFGPTPVKRLGGTKIKFPTGIGGISGPTTYNNQAVFNLFLEGGDLAASGTISTYEDYTSVSAITNLSTSGIVLAGSSPSVSGCRISSFKGHGIEIYGASGGQPDYWSVDGCYLDFNRGFGLFVTGTDANVGKASHLSIEGNLLGGIYDAAFYGNTYDQAHTSQNARNGASAGTNKTISSIAVASNVATITTSTAHGWSANQWITTVPTDGTFASTGRLLTASGSTATYNFTKADSSTGAGGTAATSTGTQILAYYTALGIATGPYSTHATAGGTLLLTPYMESNQSAAVYNPNTITINAQGTSLTGVTTGHHMYGASGPEWNFYGGHWVFRPLLVGDQLLVRNLANDTNMFSVDTSGNGTFAGTLQAGSTLRFGGLAPGGIVYMTLPNAKGIYFTNAAGNANIRGIYMHSDNILYFGGSGANCDGAFTASSTANITGVSTLTGGAKVGASGTTLTQAKVYTGSLTPASVAANSVATQTFTVSGLTTADTICSFNHPSITAGVAATSYRVSSADTLEVAFVNSTAGSLTPASGVYRIVAIRS